MGRPRTGHRWCTIRRCTWKAGFALDYVDPTGKRHRVYAGERKRDAEQLRDKLLKKGLVRRGLGRSATLAEFLPDYFAEVSDRVKATTLESNRLKARHLKRLLGDLPLAEIRYALVEEYRESRRREGVATATVNRELAILSSLFTSALRRGTIESHPMRGLVKQPRLRNVRFRVLTEPEQVRLMEAAAKIDERLPEPYLYLAVLIPLDSGIRPGKEPGCVLALRWDNVDFERKLFVLPETKSGRALTIPMSERVFDALLRRRERCPSAEWVFPRRDERGHMTTVQKPFKQALAEAGLPATIRWYDLRHTAATNMALRGVPIQVVQRLLGHASITMTEQYAHSTDDAERAAVEILGRIGNKLANEDEADSRREAVTAWERESQRSGSNR